jgi:hypothetical protein
MNLRGSAASGHVSTVLGSRPLRRIEAAFLADRSAFLLALTGSPQAVADARARSDRILAGDRMRT